MNHRDWRWVLKKKKLLYRGKLPNKEGLNSPIIRRLKSLKGNSPRLKKTCGKIPISAVALGLNNRPKSRSRWEASRFVRERRPRRQIGRYRPLRRGGDAWGGRGWKGANSP